MLKREYIISLIKKVLYWNGESYDFAGNPLKFLPATRPVRRKYINDSSDVVRNDVLQINLLEQNFKSEHIIWDIGSHRGHYSIFAASVAKNTNQVFSFEPDSSAISTQIRNIRLNKFEHKIQLFDLVISGQEGTVSFLDQGGNANSHIVSSNSSSVPGVIVKQSKTLNSLLDICPKPDFVKIDTEGAEIDILKGGGKLLADKSVRFICELHPFAWESFKVDFSELTDLLNNYGRQIVLLDQERKEYSDLPYYGTVLF